MGKYLQYGLTPPGLGEYLQATEGIRPETAHFGEVPILNSEKKQPLPGRLSHINFKKNEQRIRPETAHFGKVPPTRPDTARSGELPQKLQRKYGLTPPTLGEVPLMNIENRGSGIRPYAARSIHRGSAPNTLDSKDRSGYVL